MSQEAHLLEKHAAYASLSEHLTKLPRKLTQPGLIPIAPRLYLPGELVRTNEILVLLGRSGEASYFAERTAWQAHQIVRRRLGHVEQGLREVLNGVGEVHVSERAPPKPEKRVTFREPVVCASPKLKSRPSVNRTNLAHTILKTNETDIGPAQSNLTNNDAVDSKAAVELQSSQKLNAASEDESQAIPYAYAPVAEIPQQYLDLLRAAELDEDSSEDEDDLEYGSDSDDDTTRFLTMAAAADPTIHPTSSSQIYLKESDQSIKDTNRRDETKSISKSDDPEDNEESEKRSMRLEFQDVLRNAERQTREGGVVNLMEFYDDDAATPSSVSLPPNFQPDEEIKFDDDTERYLDVTGQSAKAGEEKISADDNHLEFLREEARKEEEDERKKTENLALSESEKRRQTWEEEKKKFGNGFAKGFLATKDKQHTNSSERDAERLPAPQVTNPEVSVIQETVPVEEKITERRTSRKSSKRNRKTRETVTPEIMSVAQSQLDSNISEDERHGHFVPTEDTSEPENSHLSRFRQLRQLKRAASDGDSNR